MNKEQEEKSLNYTLLFLSNEITRLEEISKTASCSTVRHQFESRIQELKDDYIMFLEISNGIK